MKKEKCVSNRNLIKKSTSISGEKRKNMNVILHMPHTSLDVPEEFFDGLLISREEFNQYNTFMSDVCVDYLFKNLEGIIVKPKYSRLFCDVERFKDDSLEVMSKLGQGVIYTHLYDGKKFHFNSDDYRKRVLLYYDEYHMELDDLTKKLLKEKDTLLILDLHSFSEKMASTIKEGPFPDVCIGVEKEYFDQEILDVIINKIVSKGLTYAINYPYSGSLVPNCVFNHQVKGKVISFMIEVNKRVYL